MKRFLSIVFLCALLCGCSAENEQTSVDEIKIYGYEVMSEENYEPITITEKMEIKEISELAGDISEYKKAEELYEGMNSIWIDFGDGTILGMYDDVDYGNICKYVGEPYGEPYYEIPDGLREKALELLEKSK